MHAYIILNCRFSCDTQWSDVIMSTMTSQITCVSNVYSTVCSGSDQRKLHNSASLASVKIIHQWKMNSLQKGPVNAVKIRVWKMLKVWWYVFICNVAALIDEAQVTLSSYFWRILVNHCDLATTNFSTNNGGKHRVNRSIIWGANGNKITAVIVEVQMPQCKTTKKEWCVSKSETELTLLFSDLGWGLLSQFLPFRCFPNFSALSKHTLTIEYHIYIWQVSPQLSCGDTCQI